MLSKPWIIPWCRGIVTGCLFTMIVFVTVYHVNCDSEVTVEITAETQTCTPHFLGWGTSGYYVTAEKINDCVSCNAPMWSDAWCKSCHALWQATQ